MLLVEKFQDFLHRSGHTRESFARLMGVQPSLLSRLIPKRRHPAGPGTAAFHADEARQSVQWRDRV